MRKFTVSLIFLCFFSGNLAVAGTTSENSGIKDRFKKIKASIKFKAEDFKAALRLYRDVFADEPENEYLNYKIGECHLALGNVKTAKEYFEKAYALNNYVNDKIHLSLGQVYHLSGDLEKAIVEYNKYKESLKPKKVEKSEVVAFLKQCEQAKKMMDNPVDVQIKNMGSAINSEYPDYSPSISLDGKTFIFTSRRSDTKGKGRDNYDHGYYEDVYI